MRIPSRNSVRIPSLVMIKHHHAPFSCHQQASSSRRHVEVAGILERDSENTEPNARKFVSSNSNIVHYQIQVRHEPERYSIFAMLFPSFTCLKTVRVTVTIQLEEPTTQAWPL